MLRVDIPPQRFRWALERAGHDPDALPETLTNKFPKLPNWLSGEGDKSDGDRPTLKQLKNFAKAVYVPCGYLFLSEPPDESLPISDFRTLSNREVSSPSLNLMDMLYACRHRQTWYREFAQANDYSELTFVGSVKIEAIEDDSSVERVAADIRSTLGFDLEARRQRRDLREALRFFIQQAEEAGIMVMVSGIVLSNTHRKLDVEEFRGFALADRLAPLIFINGADSKSGQMFTLAHELAHLWLNVTGLSDAEARRPPEPSSSRSSTQSFSRQEVWCNKVAAELLVPRDALIEQLKTGESAEDAKERLARYFNVSRLVVLLRLLDAKWLLKADFEDAWEKELSDLREGGKKPSSGGNFYNTTVVRVGRRFARALISDTLGGKTLYRDAFRLLGVRKTKTFKELGREVGVM